MRTLFTNDGKNRHNVVGTKNRLVGRASTWQDAAYATPWSRKRKSKPTRIVG